MIFDFHQPGDGWLHRLDARVKLAAVAVVFAAVFLVDSALAAGLVVAALLVVFVAGRLDPRPFAVPFAFMAYLALVSTLLWAVLRDTGNVLVTIGPVRLRDAALDYGLLVGFRIVAMILAPLVLLAATRQDDLVQALNRCGLPYKGAFALGMAFRMLPVTAGTATTIRDAQRARGLEFDRGNPVARMRKNVALLVPLTLLSFERVERMALAVSSRGLGAVPRRTELRPLRMRPVDVAVTVGLGVVLLALVLHRVVR